MALIRWQFIDTVVADTWTVPINPNAMSSPYPTKAREHLPAAPRGEGILALQAPVMPHEWTFGGVIRMQDHYNQLLAWSEKDYPIQISDHYERTWAVLLLAFEPEDRKPTFHVPWRLRYTMRALMFGEITP